jgi:hypothetical protein
MDETRGPKELWQRFHHAITRLGTVTAGTYMLEVVRAYQQAGSDWRRIGEGCVRATDGVPWRMMPTRSATTPSTRTWVALAGAAIEGAGSIKAKQSAPRPSGFTLTLSLGRIR